METKRIVYGSHVWYERSENEDQVRSDAWFNAQGRMTPEVERALEYRDAVYVLDIDGETFRFSMKRDRLTPGRRPEQHGRYNVHTGTLGVDAVWYTVEITRKLRTTGFVTVTIQAWRNRTEADGKDTI